MRFLLAITRGIAADQSTRRRAMFAVTLAALILLFLGTIALWQFLTGHLWIFVVYWFVCGWLTLTAMLLATYDLLCVIRAGRRERRNARTETFKDLE